MMLVLSDGLSQQDTRLNSKRSNPETSGNRSKGCRDNN
jgi:hypothetical protein